MDWGALRRSDLLQLEDEFDVLSRPSRYSITAGALSDDPVGAS